MFDLGYINNKEDKKIIIRGDFESKNQSCTQTVGGRSGGHQMN
jgi:hypothetical protein